MRHVTRPTSLPFYGDPTQLPDHTDVAWGPRSQLTERNTNMDVIEILNRMKDVLIENGWSKRELEDENGSVCLVGARNRVLGIVNDSALNSLSYVADSVSDRLESVMPDGLQRLSHYQTRAWLYNDSVCKSINDVLDIIDKAILKEKEVQRDGGV